MALTQCPECNREVSSAASACPNCGYPLTREAPRSKSRSRGTVTIEQTGKNLKAQVLLSSLAIIVGLIWMIAAGGPTPPATGSMTAGGIVMMIGFVWFIATRVNIWWQHK